MGNSQTHPEKETIVNNCKKCDCCVCCHKTCCCSTHRRRVICWWVVAAMVILLALLIFFLYPRVPTVCVTTGLGSVYMTSSPYEFHATILVNVTVDNPNYVGASAKNVLFNLYYANTPPETGDSLVAAVTAADVSVSARANSTIDLLVDVTQNSASPLSQMFLDCEAHNQLDLIMELYFTTRVIATEVNFHIAPFTVKAPCGNGASSNAQSQSSPPFCGDKY